MFKPSSIFLTDRSKAVLIWWIIFVIFVLCLPLVYCIVCSLQPCGHLLGKGCPFGSLVCDVFLCLIEEFPDHTHLLFLKLNYIIHFLQYITNIIIKQTYFLVKL